MEVERVTENIQNVKDVNKCRNWKTRGEKEKIKREMGGSCEAPWITKQVLAAKYWRPREKKSIFRFLNEMVDVRISRMTKLNNTSNITSLILPSESTK